jgi:hypothetical protein
MEATDSPLPPLTFEKHGEYYKTLNAALPGDDLYAGTTLARLFRTAGYSFPFTW